MKFKVEKAHPQKFYKCPVFTCLAEGSDLQYSFVWLSMELVDGAFMPFIMCSKHATKLVEGAKAVMTDPLEGTWER